MSSISTELYSFEILAQEGENVSLLKALKPFQIVSLLDMLEFDVFQFVRYSDTLRGRLHQKHRKNYRRWQTRNLFAASSSWRALRAIA